MCRLAIVTRARRTDRTRPASPEQAPPIPPGERGPVSLPGGRRPTRCRWGFHRLVASPGAIVDDDFGHEERCARCGAVRRVFYPGV